MPMGGQDFPAFGGEHKKVYQAKNKQRADGEQELDSARNKASAFPTSAQVNAAASLDNKTDGGL